MRKMPLAKMRCMAKHKKGDGCFSCGWYGYIFEEAIVCDQCKRHGWVRPGSHTVYRGKKWVTVDGIEITQVEVDKRLCPQCLVDSQKESA